jgi:ferredoxin
VGVVKVRVDPSHCVGHGRCYELAPEVFDEDERGHCRILHPEIAPELEERARLGETNCPERAISVERD